MGEASGSNYSKLKLKRDGKKGNLTVELWKFDIAQLKMIAETTDVKEIKEIANDLAETR